MAVIKQGGQGGAVNFRWQGATVLQAWQAQIQAGMEAEAAEILTDLRQEIHVDTGDMRDKAFAEVIVAGTKRTLRAGSASDHAIYEEYRPGHATIRPVLDKHIPHITQKIAAARQGGR